MTSFEVAFSRRERCCYVWGELRSLVRKPINAPHSGAYYIPAAMALFKTWGDWDEAVLKFVGREQLARMGREELGTPFQWVGYACLLRGMSSSLTPGLPLTTANPFKSAMHYIALCNADHKILCNQLTECFK